MIAIAPDSVKEPTIAVGSVTEQVSAPEETKASDVEKRAES